jgi:di/tricarboxylate transporter
VIATSPAYHDRPPQRLLLNLPDTTSLLPGTLVGRDAGWVAAAAVFAASYLALAVGRVPGLAIDRAGVALVGACLMVAGGALPLAEAYKAVDLDTLTLLLGMMIVVANLRLSGFFAQASGWVMRRARYPLALLAAVTAVAGVFSAFLVNDAICLVLAPLVLELTLSLRRNPVPYLLAVAMASNIGSTATITGNPQNMMIGSFSQIPYAQFTARSYCARERGGGTWMRWSFPSPASGCICRVRSITKARSSTYRRITTA